MISFWRIFWLELTTLVRTKTVALLAAVSVVWMFVFPYVIQGDGTAAGEREMYIHFSLGGVFWLLVIALLASATGSLARERAAKRLQLTQVRPIRYTLLVLGKILAHATVGAFVLALSALILAFRVDGSARCNHVLSPILPSPAEEAVAMYESYVNDPETPKAIKRAKRSAVLRILEQRAIDHYQTIPTNETAVWRFDHAGDAVRLRFTNALEMRQDLCGVFRSGAASTSVSNITQAVLVIPFRGETGELSFQNCGKSALMLRPRRDLQILAGADTFHANLVRALIVLVAVLTLVAAIGMLLSAGLGRPVAIFVAFVMLIVSEMSPSVIDQYPNPLDARLADRIGLAITRTAAKVTRPVSALAPLEALSKDECVEWENVIWNVTVNFLALPVLLSLLAAFVLPRKQDADF